VVLDPHRWLGLRQFRPLYESGAMNLREIARETGLNRQTSARPQAPRIGRAEERSSRSAASTASCTTAKSCRSTATATKNRLQVIERDTGVA
jgi:hypothetical protein